MTAITKSYRFRCATAGASVVDGNVDWTETVRIASVGEIGGQTVHPLRGGTTARPWSVEIVDVSEVITARLAGADGRAQLLRRLADISESTDGGSTWTVLATARIDRIEMVNVTSFRFTMQDERLIERTTTIFKAGNTTRLLPQGLQANWLVYQKARTRGFQVTTVDAGNNTTAYTIGPDNDAAQWEPMQVPDAVMELLESDIVDNPAAHGVNFTALRANINGTDRQVCTFNGAGHADPLKNLRDQAGRLLSFTVSGYEDPDWPIQNTRQVYFHMQSRDPSPELPLHIGGQQGVDPFTFVKAIYDGDYQDAANPATVRYDSDAFSAYDPSTNPNGLIDNPRFPKMHWRITGPANMAQWLEENIYGPLGVVPFVNAAGEVSPRIVGMPAVDQVPDPDALPELTASNLTEPHPSWLNEGRDMVTVVEYTFEYAIAPSYTALKGSGSGLFGTILRPITGGLLPTAGGQDTGVDLLVQKSTGLTREHDRAATARVVHEVTVRGLHRPIDQRRYADEHSRNLFDRFGDGPVYTDAAPLSSVADIEEGDWVKINLPGSYPALQNQSRTGGRIAQVMTKVHHPDGPRYDLIEGGPNDQPMGAPSISLAANTNDAENAIDVTVSGLETDGFYEVHLAVGASEPDEEDPDWQYRHLRGQASGTSVTLTVRGLPAGSTIWGRARETGVGRISSDWSTADSQATTGLTAPSGVAESELSAEAATITWTNGETDFDVMLDVILTADSSQVKEPVRLAAGAARYRVLGLDASTGYTVRVWHVDRYGGESTKATDTLTTTGTAQTLPAMRGIAVLVGAAA